MQDSNKNTSGNKNYNQNQTPSQPNQKQPIRTPGQEGSDKKFNNNSDVKKPEKNLGHQDNSGKR